MNKSQIYIIVKSQFMEKKARAEALAYENLMSAKKDSKFLELFLKERELRFDIAKGKSRKIDTKKLEENLQKTIEEKKQRLITLGISEESLSPKYECPLCSDTGLKNGRRCICFDKAIKQKMIDESSKNLSNLPTFDKYNEKIASNETHKTQLAKLKKYMQNWVDDTSETKPHLICISGDTGVGKSYLTECTATYALKKGYLVSLLTAFSMNNVFLKYVSAKNDEKFDVLDTLIDPDLLVIDDLGAEPLIKNITIEYLFTLLNERLAQKKATIITTNLGSGEILDRYGDRIFSRIFNKQESFNARITGSDLRLKKNN